MAPSHLSDGSPAPVAAPTHWPCRPCLHPLMAWSDWGQHQQQVWVAAAAPIAPQEHGEVEKPSGEIRAGSHLLHLLMALSEWDWCQAPAAGVSSGSGARQDRGVWNKEFSVNTRGSPWQQQLLPRLGLAPPPPSPAPPSHHGQHPPCSTHAPWWSAHIATGCSVVPLFCHLVYLHISLLLYRIFVGQVVFLASLGFLWNERLPIQSSAPTWWHVSPILLACLGLQRGRGETACGLMLLEGLSGGNFQGNLEIEGEQSCGERSRCKGKEDLKSVMWAGIQPLHVFKKHR